MFVTLFIFAKITAPIMEEMKRMILFTILALILLIMVVITILVTSVVGAGALIIFGDVIVLAIIIGFIIKKLFFD